MPKYLLYALQAPALKDRMLAAVAGVAITRLTLKKLKATESPLAPLDQQGHIVAELDKRFSRLDETVANLKRVNSPWYVIVRTDPPTRTIRALRCSRWRPKPTTSPPP